MTLASTRYRLRKRRRHRAGLPDLSITHRFPDRNVGAAAPTALATVIATGSVFPTTADRNVPMTFATSLRIDDNAGQHRGLIFEIGGNASGMAAWLDDDTIHFRAGGVVPNGAFATHDAGAELEVGRIYDLIFVVEPRRQTVGFYDVRRGESIVDGGALLATNTSASAWPSSGQAFGVDNGGFAMAVQSTIHDDVTQTGAPDGFTILEPLRVYQGQLWGPARLI